MRLAFTVSARAAASLTCSPRANAALESVNLAAPLADGQQVLVPSRSQEAAVGEQAPSPAGGRVTGPLALNSATVSELEAPPGVGPITAQKIVEFRDAHGAFRSVDELDAIPGIGPGRLDQLRELVTV